MRIIIIACIMMSFQSVCQDKLPPKPDCNEVDAVTWKEAFGESSPKESDFTGCVKKCFKNGAIRLSYYKNGLRNGIYALWKEDGSLAYLLNYVQDRKTGFQRMWHDNGQLMYERNTVNGLIIDQKGWYDNGQQEIIVNVTKARFSSKEWYENGHMKLESYKKNTKRDSVFRKWNEAGQLIAEQHFKEGMLHGIKKEFYQSGEKAGLMYKKSIYKNDKKMGIECHWDYDGQFSNYYWWKHGSLTLNSNRDGTFTSTDDDAKIKYEISINKNAATVRSWEEDGTFIMEKKYINGAVVQCSGNCK